MAVVTAQPHSDKGMMGGPSPQYGMQPMGVVIPNFPPSLQYLQTLDEIRIHQEFQGIEALIGWERKNRYNVCNSDNQKILFALEDTDCCTRQLLGSLRPFQLHMTDNDGNVVIQLDRPCRCQGSCMWCCCMQEMTIESPPGMAIATIKQVWTCWTPKYKVFNMAGDVLFNIVGDCCYCKCCTDVHFKVYDGDGHQEVADIIKHWGGWREVCASANDFTIRLPRDMSLLLKVILLGSTFLVDYMYFEQNSNN